MLVTKKRYTVNFPEYLSDCELNYYRLQRLMPSHSENRTVGLNSGNAPTKYDDIIGEKEWHYIIGNAPGNSQNTETALSIRLQECAKHTTTINVNTYFQQRNHGSYLKNYDRDHNKDNPIVQKNIFSVLSHIIRDKISAESQIYSLDVRIYHDASVAEVIVCQGHRHIQPYNEYPNRYMYQSDEKAQLNRFLGELLELCLSQGRVMQNIITIE